HYEWFKDQFATEEDFQKVRNKFGALLLLPKDKNVSYNDNPFEEKLPMYFSENLLARSLHKLCYQNNPGFLRFIQKENLKFSPFDHFSSKDIEKRQELYKQICDKIWNVPL
ncbi:MAG: DUF1524 domain-containing protein, partial [Methanolinea sp.]|nr:DUF1524 domain-containing protein [Methanolinea sp.]